jgi:hypothetical protein
MHLALQRQLWNEFLGAVEERAATGVAGPDAN